MRLIEDRNLLLLTFNLIHPLYYLQTALYKRAVFSFFFGYLFYNALRKINSTLIN